MNKKKTIIHNIQQEQENTAFEVAAFIAIFKTNRILLLLLKLPTI